MGRLIYNDGEEIVQQDHNDEQALQEQEVFDDVFKRMFQSEDGFLGQNSFFVDFVNSTTVNINPGRGFQTITPASSREPAYVPIDLDAITPQTLDGADGSNPRIDIIAVKWDTVVSETDTRDFKAPITGTITPTLFDKVRRWSSDIQYVAGTPSGSPSAPATPAGYLKICEILVPTGAGPASQNDLTDTRNLLAIPAAVGVDLDTSAYLQVPTKAAGTPLATVTSELDGQIDDNQNSIDAIENAALLTEGAALVGLKVDVPGDWDVEPVNAKDALDELGSRATVLENLTNNGEFINSSLSDHCAPADRPDGLGNTGLTDTVARNPRGLNFSDLKMKYGIERLEISQIELTGLSDSAGLPEWRVTAPVADERIRLYGMGWENITGTGGSRVRTEIEGDYILFTDVMDGIGILTYGSTVESDDIRVELDTVDLGISLSPRGSAGLNSLGWRQMTTLSDVAMQGFGMDIHTVKIINQSNDANAFMNIFGLQIVGDAGEITQLPGRVYADKQPTDFATMETPAGPTVTDKGGHVVRYIDPADNTRKWAVRNTRRIETVASSIGAGASVISVTDADPGGDAFIAGDIVELDDGTNRELVRAQSVNIPGNTITIVGTTAFAYTNAVVTLYGRTTNIDRDDFGEVLKEEFLPREFGQADVIGFTFIEGFGANEYSGLLEDGATSLVARDGGITPNSLAPNATIEGAYMVDATTTPNNQLRFTFNGTGLALLHVQDNGASPVYTVDIDGVLVENLTTGLDSVSIVEIASGLPEGTHVCRIHRTDAGSNNTVIPKFYVYHTDEPAVTKALQEGVKFAQWNKPSDFVFDSRSAAVSGYGPSRGALIQHAWRGVHYVNGGTGTLDWLRNVSVGPFERTGSEVYTDRQNATALHWFYGTGVEFMYYAGPGYNTVQVKIDGNNATSGNFPGVTVHETLGKTNAFNFTLGQQNSANATASLHKTAFTGLTEGWHSISLETLNATQQFYLNAFSWIGSPGFMTDNISFDLATQSNHFVGSLLDSRKLGSDLKKSRKANWAYVQGVNAAPVTTSSNEFIVADMVAVIKTEGKNSAIRACFNANSNNTGAQNLNTHVRVDGERSPVSQSQGAAGEDFMGASEIIKSVGPGKHIAIGYFATSGGTMTVNGRTLTVHEITGEDS